MLFLTNLTSLIYLIPFIFQVNNQLFFDEVTMVCLLCIKNCYLNACLYVFDRCVRILKTLIIFNYIS